MGWFHVLLDYLVLGSVSTGGSTVGTFGLEQHSSLVLVPAPGILLGCEDVLYFCVSYQLWPCFYGFYSELPGSALETSLFLVYCFQHYQVFAFSNYFLIKECLFCL